jgi:hypothetical protein
MIEWVNEWVGGVAAGHRWGKQWQCGGFTCKLARLPGLHRGFENHTCPTPGPPTCTTFVRSRQSMQLVRNTPACWPRVPALSWNQ